MRYLKKINELRQDTYNWIPKEFECYIDCNIIDDIIDMSMDYIDEGMKLLLVVYNMHKIILIVKYKNYKKVINEYFNNIELHNGSLTSPIMEYDIHIYDKKDHFNKSASVEIFDRISIAYPSICFIKPNLI